MHLLWIGAHPDDELFVAPYLGAMRERGARIDFLLATRGEQGPCYRPEGCEPDLGTVREREMRDAAALFGGSAAFADCRDGSGGTPQNVLAAWARDAGGADPLRARFVRGIEAFAPEEILTLDPEHSGHADHRAVGRLVLSLGLAMPVTLAESRPTWRAPMSILPAVENATAFDARAHWQWLVRDLECHRSQMRPETIDAFASVAEDERKVWLLRRIPNVLA